jgi:hypothetical protein
MTPEVNVEKCDAYPQEEFRFKILHSAFLIKKYVKYLKRGYPTKFVDST